MSYRQSKLNGNQMFKKLNFINRPNILELSQTHLYLLDLLESIVFSILKKFNYSSRKKYYKTVLIMWTIFSIPIGRQIHQNIKCECSILLCNRICILVNGKVIRLFYSYKLLLLSGYLYIFYGKYCIIFYDEQVLKKKKMQFYFIYENKVSEYKRKYI